MINPNELRIGNIIMCGGIIGSVEQIGGKGTLLENRRVIKFKEGHQGFVLNCEGVELSPEVLLRCGVDYFDHREKWQYKDTAIQICDSESGGYKLYGSDIAVPFKYLHQLQNLIFALNNTELILSPKKEGE